MTGRPPQLYREGYFAAQASNAEGEVIIPPSLSLTAYACASVALLLAIAAFLLLGQYTRKARLEGVVMPSTGLIKVMARSGGQVSAGLAAEGESVKAGQPLYRLSGEHFNGRGAGALAAVSASLNQQYRMLEQQQAQERSAGASQQAGIRRRMSQLEDELGSAASALALSQQQAKLSRSVMDRYRLLSAKKYVSAIELQQKRIELSAALERVEIQRQVQLRLRRDLSAAASELQAMREQLQGRDAELARQLHGLHQQQIELAAQAENTLTAPVDGQIVAVLARVGQTVKQHDALLMMVAEGARLQVELYAPSKAAGFIKPQQRVGLRFAAFPYEKFGVQYGHIQAITRASLSAADAMPQNPMVWKENEGHYRVTVALDKTAITAYGRQEPLRIGMAVAADVELDSRRLYEWLLEPLWSLKGRM
ncbi:MULTISPECIES: HlyD family secretion protein [Serratia]|uniref:HlyD family secretion protein n=1 Tax=Serratia TaxID=613 RepID=UPI00077C388D|nr:MULTISPECIES: HlyD family efflux transporter periplasmic adaptor subunit [Serratia]CAI1226453.1 Colicin V secretion protein CvaA [Serratia ficaria]CAI1228755.1 Colicin V secretion protein CvaA [Serratia ficaria]CAI1499122.1 Colicin V secretion protein CvaA [Serratia ficaria]CAI1504115.1 Colicin V secretion protein CvaA [Serratia ficaria]CAI2019464.1 Colicin V secretion protein CvaA [Serratia ficaria]